MWIAEQREDRVGEEDGEEARSKLERHGVPGRRWSVREEVDTSRKEKVWSAGEVKSQCGRRNLDKK